jgi:hypothetical protein
LIGQPNFCRDLPHALSVLNDGEPASRESHPAGNPPPAQPAFLEDRSSER